ncbi:MAG: flagellar basal body-associated FliL family protein [Desulfobacteraceae bacterium]|nr:flagellar basal body-associated FliL family protein [Desulfobacteraceae bacterium]
MDLKGPFIKVFKKLPNRLLTKKFVIISVSIAVFIVLLSSALVFFLKSDKDEQALNKESKSKKFQVNIIDYDNIIVLKPFIWISLQEKSHMDKISVNIALEVNSREQVGIVEAEINKIRAHVRSAALEMRWIELRSPEGKIKFKYMLIKKINSLFPDIVIRNLYLTHFMMR